MNIIMCQILYSAGFRFLLFGGHQSDEINAENLHLKKADCLIFPVSWDTDLLKDEEFTQQLIGSSCCDSCMLHWHWLCDRHMSKWQSLILTCQLAPQWLCGYVRRRHLWQCLALFWLLRDQSCVVYVWSEWILFSQWNKWSDFNIWLFQHKTAWCWLTVACRSCRCRCWSVVKSWSRRKSVVSETTMYSARNCSCCVHRPAAMRRLDIRWTLRSLVSANSLVNITQATYWSLCGHSSRLTALSQRSISYRMHYYLCLFT